MIYICRNQPGTGIRGPSPVPECSGPDGDFGCRNAYAGGISLDADTQLWITIMFYMTKCWLTSLMKKLL